MTHYLTLGPWRMSWRVIIIALLAMALALQLGRWQTHRAQAKIELQERLFAAAHNVALPIDGAHPQAAGLIWHRVVASGSWLPQDVIYLDNRPMADRVGFYVMMPLQLASGAVVLVNRGWLPRDANARSRIAAYDTPAGVVDVEGIAMPDEAHFLDLGGAAPKIGSIWENFSFDQFVAAAGITPLRMVIRQDNPSLDGLARDWPDRGAVLQEQINRHYGYVFQWDALAFAMLLLLLYYGIKRGRRHGA